MSQEYFNRIYQSSICIFKLVCTSWSRTTWNQFFKNPSEAERSHCHFLDLEECCFESPIQNLNTGLRSLHFLLSFMCRLAWHSPNFPGTHTQFSDLDFKNTRVSVLELDSSVTNIQTLRIKSVNWQQLPWEVSISYHGFWGATGFSFTGEMKHCLRNGCTRERDAFQGLALCCRTSGFCETPACPKEAPAAVVNPAVAVQALWGWDALGRRERFYVNVCDNSSTHFMNAVGGFMVKLWSGLEMCREYFIF